MGLDMYLNAKRYLSDYSEEDKKVIEGVKNLLDTNGMRVNYVVLEAMYWRKANAIHRWFVDNVQEGNDDCGNYHVSREKLKELLEIVSRVLADHSLADELLPSQQGFFFGNIDYDEWYFEQLEYTKEELEKILSWVGESYTWEFEYHSSW